MKIETVTSTKAPLSGAFYTITRAGQQPISEGNAVQVAAKLHLPAISEYDDTALQPDVRFVKRLLVGLRDKDTRYCEATFVALTWSIAFAVAKEVCEGQIAKLEAANVARAQALVDAEN